MTLSGEVALITGAASGLGLAVAERMAEEGAALVLVDWTAGALESAAKALTRTGAEVAILSGDVSVAGTAAAAVQLAESRFGKLDILVNNAGIDPLQARSVLETEESEWDRILAVNAKGAYLFSKAAIPLMRQRGGGSIVCTSSVAAFRSAPDETAYAVSKAALSALTRAMARDFARDGIRANCVCPGPMEMVMTDRRKDLSSTQREERASAAEARVPLGRQGSYKEVAQVVVFLAGPGASYVTGVDLVVDGGLLLT